MADLPKVSKGIVNSLTKLESVKRVVLSVALVAGLTVGAGQSAATPTSGDVTPAFARENSGAMLLTPSVAPDTSNTIAQHYSHYSHSSHESHYSHYSSRE